MGRIWKASGFYLPPFRFGNWMMTDEEIDLALLSNITTVWRKMAFVIGITMMGIDTDERKGMDDLYFAKRVSALFGKGLIEHKGDLDQLRYCEIRLSTTRGKFCKSGVTPISLVHRDVVSELND